MAAGLPQDTLGRIQAAPERFVERMAEIIAGYGGAEGIDANGIARYIAVTRAEARARRMTEMLAADLDNDGAITAAEVATLAPLLEARQRGRLVEAHRRGDADGDGEVTTAELQALAERAAQRRVSARAATALQGLMAFDLDGNAVLSTAELGQVVAAALAPWARPRTGHAARKLSRPPLRLPLARRAGFAYKRVGRHGGTDGG